MAIMVFMQLCFCWVIPVDIVFQSNCFVASAEPKSSNLCFKWLSTTARKPPALCYEACSLRNAPCVTGARRGSRKKTQSFQWKHWGQSARRLRNPTENTVNLTPEFGVSSYQTERKTPLSIFTLCLPHYSSLNFDLSVSWRLSKEFFSKNDSCKFCFLSPWKSVTLIHERKLTQHKISWPQPFLSKSM